VEGQVEGKRQALYGGGGGDARLTEVLHEHLDVELEYIHSTQRLHYLLLKCLLAWQLLLLWHLQSRHPCSLLVNILTHVRTGRCFVLLVWFFLGTIGSKLSVVQVGFVS